MVQAADIMDGIGNIATIFSNQICLQSNIRRGGGGCRPPFLIIRLKLLWFSFILKSYERGSHVKGSLSKESCYMKVERWGAMFTKGVMRYGKFGMATTTWIRATGPWWQVMWVGMCLWVWVYMHGQRPARGGGLWNMVAWGNKSPREWFK